mgnify:CR=1 FL=1
MNEPSLDKLNVIASALQQYVLVANNIRFRTAEGGYMWDQINRLFPDLKEFDSATLEEYVYTANNPEYKGNYNIINEKFKEDFNFSDEYFNSIENVDENLFKTDAIRKLFVGDVKPGDEAFGKSVVQYGIEKTVGGIFDGASGLINSIFKPLKEGEQLYRNFGELLLDKDITVDNTEKKKEKAPPAVISFNDIPELLYNYEGRDESDFGMNASNTFKISLGDMPSDFNNVLQNPANSFEREFYNNNLSYNQYQQASNIVVNLLDGRVKKIEEQEERLAILGPERYAFEEYIMKDPSMAVKGERYNGYHFHKDEKEAIRLLSNWANNKKYENNPYFGFKFEPGYIIPLKVDTGVFGTVKSGLIENTIDNWIIATAPFRYDTKIGAWVGGEQQKFQTGLKGRAGVKEMKRLQEWMLNPVDTYNGPSAFDAAVDAGRAQADLYRAVDPIFGDLENIDDISDKDLQKMIEAIEEVQTASADMKALMSWSKSYNEYREDGENWFMSTMNAINDEGIKGFGQAFVSSTVGMFNEESLKDASASAVAGAGATWYTGYGALGGGFVAGMTSMNYNMETIATFTQILQEELEAIGDNMTPNNIRRLLENDEFRAEIKRRARLGGASVAATELITSMLGIKGSSAIIKTVGKTTTTAKITGTTLTIPYNVTTDVAGGMTGEYTKIKTADLKFDEAGIILEGLSPAPISIATETLIAYNSVKNSIKSDVDSGTTGLKEVKPVDLRDQTRFTEEFVKTGNMETGYKYTRPQPNIDQEGNLLDGEGNVTGIKVYADPNGYQGNDQFVDPAGNLIPKNGYMPYTPQTGGIIKAENNKHYYLPPVLAKVELTIDGTAVSEQSFIDYVDGLKTLQDIENFSFEVKTDVGSPSFDTDPNVDAPVSVKKINQEAFNAYSQEAAKRAAAYQYYVQDKIDSIKIDSEISDRITNAEDRSSLVDLEKRRVKAEQDSKKTGASAVPGVEQELQNINNGINEILNKYAEVVPGKIPTKKIEPLPVETDASIVELDESANAALNTAINKETATVKKQMDAVKDKTGDEGDIVELSNEDIAESQTEIISLLEAEVEGYKSRVAETESGTTENTTAKQNLEDTENKLEAFKTADKQFGYIIDRSDGSYDIIINKDNYKEGVAAHEFFHKILSRTLRNDQVTQDAFGNAVTDYVNEKYGGVSQEFVDRMSAYIDPKTGQRVSEFGEETMTIMAESIVDGTLTFNDSFFTKIGDFVRQTLQRLGLKKIKFNTGRDVFNFIKDYAKSIKKDYVSKSIIDVAAKGSEGDLVTGAQRTESTTKFSRSKAVTAVNEIENNLKNKLQQERKEYTQNEFRRSAEFGQIFDSINNENGPINNYIKGLKMGPEKTEQVIEKASQRLFNYNPQATRKTDIKEGITIGERIMSDISFAKLDADKALAIAAKKEGKTTRIDAAKRTKEGETTFDIKDTEVETSFETEDLSPAAQARKAQIKKQGQKESQFRKQLGIKTGGKVYNLILDAARQSLLKAYESKTSVRNIQIKLRNQASGYLWKTFKNFLSYGVAEQTVPRGTKDIYLSQLKKFRVPIINSLFTGDLVQIERNIPDAEKIFTKFKKKLTKKAEVENAVDQLLLPPSALQSYDRDKSVNLYERILQIEGDQKQEDDFITFYNQPPISPKTGLRSGLKGTRKDAIARAMSGALSFDATMQVAKEPEIIKRRTEIAELKGETLAKDDIETLGANIGRDPDVKFSKKHDKEYNSKRANDFIVRAEKNGLNDILLSIDTKDISWRVALKQLITKDSYDYSGLYRIPEIKNAIKNLRTLRNKENLESKKNSYYIEQHGINNFKNAISKDSNVKLLVEEVAEGENPDIQLEVNSMAFGVELKADKAKGPKRFIYIDIDKIIESKGTEYTIANNKTSLNPGKIDALVKQSIPALKQIKELLKDKYGIKNFILSTAAGQKQTLIPEAAWQDIKKNKLDALATSYEWVKTDFISYDYINKAIPSFYITTGRSGTYTIGDADPLNMGDQVANFEQLGVPIPLTIRMVGDKRKNGTMRRVGFIVETQIDSRTFEKQNINFFKQKDVEKVVTKFSKDNFTSERIIDDAVLFSRSSKNKPKGITILDFDDTLATTKSMINFTRPDGTKGKLNAEQYAATYEELAAKGYEFDFSEFSKVIEGKKAPLFEKALKLQKKFGPKNMFVLTARPPDSAMAIYGFLRANGLNIPITNITGLANSTSEAKALWVAEKVGEGYNDFYFADDALQNVQAVKNILDQFDVKSKVQQAKVDFKQDLNTEFNKIIQQTTGVQAVITFSDAQARLRGNKAKFGKSIIPASAQDFVGLLYNFLDKGRRGEQQMKFFKKYLLDPFARGINELNASKQNASTDYKNLLKQNKDIKKDLTSKLKSFEGYEGVEFSVDQAIRVYLWDKNGFEIPGLSKRDTKLLSDFVKTDTKLKQFADNIGKISKRKEGYAEPGKHWLVENINSDLLSDGAIGDVRSKFLSDFIENKNEIFSKENLNKVQALYGKNFREALEDMLFTMETGRNRKQGTNRLVNMYQNWVNNSVGAIMFFNMRSALLQTISLTNYINWADNNPLNAGMAFANQKQYWSDFVYLFNSDYLKQRRAGNQRGINEAEISAAVAGSQNKAKAAVAWILQKGFLPTQVADSFAISSGGATFYRNRIKSYLKEGRTLQDAEAQAFVDFQEITEVSQQSARPDMLSQQQKSPLGRLILAFANYPMQAGRIMNKAFRDIANKRGDTKTHISKIIYYGFVMNIVFHALQSAMFAMLDDEEELDKKSDRALNNMLDTWLVTLGFGGKAVSTIKNSAVEYQKQRAKDVDEEFLTKSDHTYTILQLLSFSPPISSKIRKIYQSIQTEKYNREVFKRRGFTLDNPVWAAVGNVIEGVTNIPLGRLANKLLNIDNALDSSNTYWQRAALLLGWNTWDLGIKDKDIEATKAEIKQEKQKQKDIEKEQKKKLKEIEKEEGEEFKKQIFKDSSKQIEQSIYSLKKEQQEALLIDLGVKEDEISKLNYKTSMSKKIIQLKNEGNNEKIIKEYLDKYIKPKNNRKRKSSGTRSGVRSGTR